MTIVGKSRSVLYVEMMEYLTHILLQEDGKLVGYISVPSMRIEWIFVTSLIVKEVISSVFLRVISTKNFILFQLLCELGSCIKTVTGVQEVQLLLSQRCLSFDMLL